MKVILLKTLISSFLLLARLVGQSMALRTPIAKHFPIYMRFHNNPITFYYIYAQIILEIYNLHNDYSAEYAEKHLICRSISLYNVSV